MVLFFFYGVCQPNICGNFLKSMEKKDVAFEENNFTPKKRINLDPYNEVQIKDLRVLVDEFNPVST